MFNFQKEVTHSWDWQFYFLACRDIMVHYRVTNSIVTIYIYIRKVFKGSAVVTFHMTFFFSVIHPSLYYLVYPALTSHSNLTLPVPLSPFSPLCQSSSSNPWKGSESFPNFLYMGIPNETYISEDSKVTSISNRKYAKFVLCVWITSLKMIVSNSIYLLEYFIILLFLMTE